MTARGAPGTEGAGSTGRLAATAGPDGAASDCTGGLAKIGPETGPLLADWPDDSAGDGAAEAAAGGSLRASRGGRGLPSGMDRRRLSIGPGGGGRRLALPAAASG